MPDQRLTVIARDDDYTLRAPLAPFTRRGRAPLAPKLTRDGESGFTYPHDLFRDLAPFPRPTDDQREVIAAAARELVRSGRLD